MRWSKCTWRAIIDATRVVRDRQVTWTGMLAQQLLPWLGPSAAWRFPSPWNGGPSAALPAASADACCVSLPAWPQPQQKSANSKASWYLLLLEIR